MDLLNLGSQSRKTGLKPKSNTKKDKYNMEDLDDFFRDEDTPETSDKTKRSSEVKTGKSSHSSKSISARTSIGIPIEKKQPNSLVRKALTKSSNKANTYTTEKEKIVSPIEAVARKLDFNHSIPVPSLKAAKTSPQLKKSPLLSPLQDDNKYVEDSFVDQGFDNDIDREDVDYDDQMDIHNNDQLDEDENSADNIKQRNDNPHNALARITSKASAKVQERLNSQQQTHKEQYLKQLQEFGVSDDEFIEEQKAPRKSKPKKSEASAMTKRMALGKATKAKKRRQPTPEPVEEFESSSNESMEVEEAQSPEAVIEEEIRSDIETFTQPKKLKRLTQNPPDREDVQQETTPEVQGLRRSRRHRVEPLAFWRNEKIVYTRANDADTPVQEIKEVVYVPEVTSKAPARKSTNREGARAASRSRTRLQKNSEVEYASDPEVSGSEWYKDGNLQIEIFEGTGSDNRIQRTVAWAPGKETYITPANPKNGDNFKVAILFDENRDFAASGMLEIPFNGLKALKNTDDTYFIFHVVQGLIEVSLSGSDFIVTSGCSFEVPMGNFYQFKNIGKSVARLFFVQTKYVSVQPEEDWED